MVAQNCKAAPFERVEARQIVGGGPTRREANHAAWVTADIPNAAERCLSAAPR